MDQSCRGSEAPWIRALCCCAFNMKAPNREAPQNKQLMKKNGTNHSDDGVGGVQRENTRIDGSPGRRRFASPFAGRPERPW